MEPDERNDDLDLPHEATDPLARFLGEHLRVLHFIGFVSQLATRADEVVRIAREALGDARDRLGAEGEETPGDSSDGRSATEVLRGHRQLILQMALTRATDNLVIYLSDLLALAFREKPEMLHAKMEDTEGSRGRQPESVPLDVVLEHETMEDLRNAIVERRVTNLSYRGMRALSDYLNGQLGFQLFEAEYDLARAVDIVERRNLITHNRAVINRQFLSRVPEPLGYKLGEVVGLDVDGVFGDIAFISTSARSIDDRASTKWSLPRGSFSASTLFPETGG